MSSSFPETVPHGGSGGSSEPQPPDLQGSPCDLLLALPHRHPVSQCVYPLKHVLSPRSLALSPGLVVFHLHLTHSSLIRLRKRKASLLPPSCHCSSHLLEGGFCTCPLHHVPPGFSPGLTSFWLVRQPRDQLSLQHQRPICESQCALSQRI